MSNSSHHVDGTLKRGFTILGKKYLKFRIREADVDMMIAAETEVGPATMVPFNTALFRRQLVQVTAEDGTVYAGPFSPGMIGELKSVDYTIVARTQRELEKLGEKDPD